MRLTDPDEFVRIWNASATASEAAAVLGCTPDAAKAHAKRLRKRGHDVVHHAAGRPRANR